MEDAQRFVKEEAELACGGQNGVTGSFRDSSQPPEVQTYVGPKIIRVSAPRSSDAAAPKTANLKIEPTTSSQSATEWTTPPSSLSSLTPSSWDLSVDFFNRSSDADASKELSCMVGTCSSDQELVDQLVYIIAKLDKNRRATIAGKLVNHVPFRLRRILAEKIMISK